VGRNFTSPGETQPSATQRAGPHPRPSNPGTPLVLRPPPPPARVRDAAGPRGGHGNRPPRPGHPRARTGGFTSAPRPPALPRPPTLGPGDPPAVSPARASLASKPTPTPTAGSDRGAPLDKFRPPSLELPLIGTAALGRPAPLASYWSRHTRGTQGARNRARARQLNRGEPRAQARSLTSSPAARCPSPTRAARPPRGSCKVVFAPVRAGCAGGSDH
jgi:hypothetical protein